MFTLLLLMKKHKKRIVFEQSEKNYTNCSFYLYGTHDASKTIDQNRFQHLPLLNYAIPSVHYISQNILDKTLQ